MRELWLGARLTLAGGRTGLARTLITALGVGLGVAALLLAASLPTIHAESQGRSQAREPVLAGEGGESAAGRDGTAGGGAARTSSPATGGAPLLVASLQTEFRDHRIGGRFLQAERDGAPAPPGLERLPAPGEVFVSPALRRLLATPDGQRLLAPRIPGRVVGEIASDGLLGPHELGFYAGARDLVPGGAVQRAEGWGGTGPGAQLDPAMVLLVVIALVALLIPVGIVVGAAVRTGGEDRDRRLAALRLIGADQRMARRIAAGEAIVAATAGVVLGALLFLLARAFVERVVFQDFSLFRGDVTPVPALALLVVVGVPAAAVVVSLAALRRVVAEPLGVVRRSAAGRPRRLWWRLVLPLAGLAALLPTTVQPEDSVNSMQLALGIIAVLIGVAALLPWLVERTVAPLGAGAVAWQLAVRRLQLDPGGASRAVSGIAVAVAGAIALQMVFAGAQQLYERDTGANPDRAQMVVTGELPHGTDERPATAGGAPRGAVGERAAVDGESPRGIADELAARLATVEGVRGVSTATEYEDDVYVAPCAALRELAAIGACRAGDTFATSPTPGATHVEQRQDPGGAWREGVFTTVAPAGEPVAVHAFVRADEAAFEHVRTAAAQLDPLLGVDTLRRTAVDQQFEIVRRAMFAGAAIVMALIGFSLLLNALEQLRERRRLLAVLVAFGTRRSTLSWSLLWQSAVPVALGLAVALLTGLGLGAVLLAVLDVGLSVAWLDLLGMVAVGALVVVLVTAASLPVLFRTMRPEGLRTE